MFNTCLSEMQTFMRLLNLRKQFNKLGTSIRDGAVLVPALLQSLVDLNGTYG